MAATATGTPAMSYQELRKMAECASSYRGLPAWMVIDEDGWRVSLREPTDEECQGKVVIKCSNPETSPRPLVTHATIGVGVPGERSKSVDLLDLKGTRGRMGAEVLQADAVFWSESAVEKFVVPYYASVYGNLADEEVSAILDVLDDIRKGGEHAGAGGDQAFALAHIPKSEYVQVGGTEATFAGQTLGVLVRKPDGEHAAVPLSLYLEGRRGRKG